MMSSLQRAKHRQIKQQILDKARRCQDKGAIIQMLSVFDIDTLRIALQTMLKQHLVNNQSPMKLYYRIESLTEILGDDVCQFIVSFVDKRDVCPVNKKFKEYATKNESLRLQKWTNEKVGSVDKLNKMFAVRKEFVRLHQQQKKYQKDKKSLQR